MMHCSGESADEMVAEVNFYAHAKGSSDHFGSFLMCSRVNFVSDFGSQSPCRTKASES
jgi:hypothetical protein